MPDKPQHGGSRPVKRKDDGRLRRKMKNRVEISIGIEESHLRQLKQQYGRNWQDVVRQLIEAHLHAV